MISRLYIRNECCDAKGIDVTTIEAGHVIRFGGGEHNSSMSGGKQCSHDLICNIHYPTNKQLALLFYYY